MNENYSTIRTDVEVTRIAGNKFQVIVTHTKRCNPVDAFHSVVTNWQARLWVKRLSPTQAMFYIWRKP